MAEIQTIFQTIEMLKQLLTDSPSQFRDDTFCVMVRPCFLVIDREFPGSISTRKLVLETAKFNVITAYSAKEAVATLRKFPAIDGAVLDENMREVPCSTLIEELRQIKPGLRIVVISGPSDGDCAGADFHVESFDPRKLLEALRNLNPADVQEIEKHEEQLNRRDRDN